MSKRRNHSKTFFALNDVIILIINLIIFILSLMILIKEKSIRGSTNLFLFQFIESIIIVILNLVMLIKLFLSKYKGHNNYGMFIRFLLFYLNLSLVILTYQRSDNLNQSEIKNLGSILLYIGLFNNGFIITSMILSIIVTDKKIYSKSKKDDDKTYNLAEQMEIFEIDGSSGKSSSTSSYKN